MEVRVSAGACLLVGWFAVVNGWHLTGLVLSAAALHELGHLAALRLLGGAVTALRISVFGAELAAEGGQLSYGRELAAVLAGPLTNLLAGLALARLGYPAAAGAHLVLCAFNLLPVRPLDGGPVPLDRRLRRAVPGHGPGMGDGPQRRELVAAAGGSGTGHGRRPGAAVRKREVFVK